MTTNLYIVQQHHSILNGQYELASPHESQTLRTPRSDLPARKLPISRSGRDTELLSINQQQHGYGQRCCEREEGRHQECVLHPKVVDPRGVDEEHYHGQNVAAEDNGYYCVADDLECDVRRGHVREGVGACVKPDS